MNSFKYCVIWEEVGSETVIYGPFDTWQEADSYKDKYIASLGIAEDEEPGDYGHNFEVANYVEVT